MEPVSGKEASILALLAERPNLSSRDRKKFEGMLGYDARQIARVLSGANKRAEKEYQDAAEGLKAWAASLKERKK